MAVWHKNRLAPVTRIPDGRHMVELIFRKSLTESASPRFAPTNPPRDGRAGGAVAASLWGVDVCALSCWWSSCYSIHLYTQVRGSIHLSALLHVLWLVLVVLVEFIVSGWLGFLTGGLGGLVRQHRRQVHCGARFALGLRYRTDAVRSDKYRWAQERVTQQQGDCQRVYT